MLVTVIHGDVAGALRKLARRMKPELEIHRRGLHFIKPSEKRRRKHAEAVARERKRQREREDL